ncbi:MAG: MmgE/PrpD family protein [Burkholderiales bacterium]
MIYSVHALADYVCSLRAENMSSASRTAALRCVLDLLSAAAAGLNVPGVSATRHVAHALYGKGSGGTSTIWFSGESSNAIGAAFCNSAAASVLDLDDGHRIARGHPGACVIPAAFATAAEVGASSDELLTSIIVGYEVCVRIAAARSVHARSGVWCGYGAAAAAGWLRDTPPDKLAHALAIAGMTAPHLLSSNGGPRYPVPVGNDIKEGIPWATVGGMTALYLAESGVCGPEDILDHAPHYDSKHLLAGLGSDEPMIRGTYFKPYACCRHIHAPVDAFSDLLVRHSIKPDDIERIDVHIYEGALLISNRREPRNLVDVQFSIPYCLGLTALMGTSCLLPVENGVLGRPDVTAIANKVELHLDAALNARFPAESLCRVVVTTTHARYESQDTAPRGEASDPMSWEDLREKFRRATRNVMPAERQQCALDAVDQLEQGALDPLMRVLATRL